MSKTPTTQLADWLEHLGWQPDDLAEAVGVTGETVRSWRSGKTTPPVAVGHKVVAAMQKRAKAVKRLAPRTVDDVWPGQ